MAELTGVEAETPVEAAFPRVEGVEHRFVDAGGLRMHVAEAGQGEPLVMLHGWPQHWYEWRHLIPSLSRRYRVICPDLRGLGWTEAPADGYEKENMARDIAALLDELELDRVRLVGHDWGGFIGFLLCLRNPERVSRYLALNIIHPWMPFKPYRVGALARLWYQYLISFPSLGERVLRRKPGLVDRAFRFGAGRPDFLAPAEVEAFASRIREPARARATVSIYRTFLTRELWPLMTGRYREMRLTTPTLLLFGAKDFAIAAWTLEGFERYADDMTLELIPGVGHFIADERPDLVLDHALTFFDEEA